ncbi:MAG: hypothetical protein K0S75_830 [Clostridia bacterium]|jgi:site-specific DNA recombinase|nr:hypothetical protein [Clostridia bacterium]
MELAAIYARKSVFTDKGESIQNQIDRCSAFAAMRGWEIKVYSDEDYSGKDMNRPQFQEMLRAINRGEIQNVIFYRLDRVSRRVIDIINFIEDLNKKGIGFVSISENFDTTTPMGRAMLLITAVFAQLERETISERVKDNMLDLAKKGKWNGGRPPFGYLVEKTKVDGKNTTLLVKDPERSKIVEHIFTWAKDGESLRTISEKLISNRVSGIHNGKWGLSTVARLLHNPVFCSADQDAYDYFSTLGVNLVGSREEWDGSKGVMCYNKSSHKVGESYWKEKEDWIISIGIHEGIIPGKLFAEVSKGLVDRRLEGNLPSQKGILSAGILKCGCCGKNMNVVSGSKVIRQSNERVTYYRCRTKVVKGMKSCENTNIRTEIIDNIVVEKLIEIANNPEIVKAQINELKDKAKVSSVEMEKQKQQINKEIIKLNDRISALIDLLTDNDLPKSNIKQKISKHQTELDALQQELNKINDQLFVINNVSINADIVTESIITFAKDIENATVEEKRKLINKVVESVVWTKGKIDINIWGTGKAKELYFSADSNRHRDLHCKIDGKYYIN